MWQLKKPICFKDDKKVDTYGRKFNIDKWLLDGIEVCREGWKQAVGGSMNKHRTISSLVCRGHGPTDADASHAIKRVLRGLDTVTDVNGKRDTDRRGFASNWWKDYFLICDYLPNEEKIQIRGVI